MALPESRGYAHGLMFEPFQGLVSGYLQTPTAQRADSNSPGQRPEINGSSEQSPVGALAKNAQFSVVSPAPAGPHEAAM
ncbi:MAG: hypothetical protein PF489_02195 [Salinivirgaceae bacterium]|nr:hypothetical protein [Salinivirgaceae bacterium]